MYTRARRQTVALHSAMPVSGLALEPVTAWQVPQQAPPRLIPNVRVPAEHLPAEQTAPVPVLTRSEVRLRRTVLLVSRQAEVRRHLRACLQEQPKLRLVEVNSVSAAVSLVSELAVHLIIADPGTVGIRNALPDVRTILLADEQPRLDGFLTGPRQHVMQRPFSAETLAATVTFLLREAAVG